jgi:hypothetical protein
VVDSEHHKNVVEMTKQKSLIQSQYNYRWNNFYTEWHFITGVLSLAGLGIPFFIGGIIANIVDAIIVKVRVSSLNASINRSNAELKNNIHPDLQIMHKRINSDPDMLMHQGFFSLAKSRHQRCMKELDNRIPARKPVI